MGAKRLFGTDGIRGRAGEGWLAADAVSGLGLTAGRVLGGAGGRALLGHDGRRSGPELEAALARGLRAAGIEPVTVGLITTPGVAWLARTGDFALAAMLSASHNPAEDNGIKLFNERGEKLSDALEARIEAELAKGVEPVTEGEGATHDAALEEAYVALLTERAGAGLDLTGLKVVVDCANGGGSHVAPRVLGALGADVIAIHAEPDGMNINRGCGSTHPESLQAEVRRAGAGIGIALDGDGDRCILIDEAGEIVHGDGILTLCARHGQARGEVKDGRIVATVMSNKGLHRALREVGLSVETVDVGDRNVVEKLRAEGLSIGGEQSGHVVFGADHAYIGDGIYTALRVLRVLVESGEPLSALAAPYQPFPQVLVNVRVASKPALDDLPAIRAQIDDVESELGEDGRVLVRYSGTEPLCRVMIEGPDVGTIQARADSLAASIEAEIGQR